MHESLFRTGVYTAPEAARLLRAPYQKVRGWLAGYPNTQSGPLLDNELKDYEDGLFISFTNLMEARFVAFFSSHGVHVRTLRAIAEEAKTFLDTPHPFATNAIFRTDGKDVFIEAASKTDDKHLYNLKKKNWMFHDIIEQSLLKGVEFDPSGKALNWIPRMDIAPNVIVNPNMAFGQPVLKGIGVPTSALFDALNVEGETYESVAGWYDVPIEAVKEAALFEMDLARAS